LNKIVISPIYSPNEPVEPAATHLRVHRVAKRSYVVIEERVRQKLRAHREVLFTFGSRGGVLYETVHSSRLFVVCLIVRRYHSSKILSNTFEDVAQFQKLRMLMSMNDLVNARREILRETNVYVARLINGKSPNHPQREPPRLDELVDAT